MDYTKIGLNSKLQRLNSIPDRQVFIGGIDFENQYEVQGARINSSKANLGEFIKRSVGGTALGTFTSSQALNVTSAITYNTPKAANKTFGKPIIAFYQGAGTASADQIYPIRGANVTLGRYDVVGGENNYATYDGTSDNWSGMIIDTGGTSNQVITFAADWIFTDYVTDNVA